MRLALIVLLPLLGALLPGLLIRTGRNACAMAAGIPTLLALALLLTYSPQIQDEPALAAFTWMPQLGLDVQFRLDGLSFLFAALILGIGLLIIVYARFYLSARDRVGVFFTYLLLFQASMLGIVLSDNLLLLVFFWELTSLTSFLLIGFWSWLQAGRRGALMALAVTGAGGLALLAGVLLLGQVAGTYVLSDLLQRGELIRQSPWYGTILTLVLIGCFTKSAQFPFHFWLPRAMAAPTPVSAYLHSATMVKAGVFLLARLWPILAGTDAWFYSVVTVGAITMLVGAAVALFKDDLKAILAFSTVSHLGIMTMLLGMGTAAAATAAMVHLINHALFKAALFLGAGIIDHETGTRDLQRLGGLWRWLPLTAAAMLLAAMANAGLPPLGGFLSKELVVEAALHTTYLSWTWTLPVVVGLAASLSIAYTARFYLGTFTGAARWERAPDAADGDRAVSATHPHDPTWGLLFPPVALAALALVAGVWPAWLVEPLGRMAAEAVVHDPSLAPELALHLWHGVTPALAISAAAVIAGLALASVLPWCRRVWGDRPTVDLGEHFERIVRGGARTCQRVVAILHNGSLQRYLFLTLAAFLVLGSLAFAEGDFQPGARTLLPAAPAAIAGWVLVIGACLATVMFCRHHLTALITVNAVGLIASIAFVYLSAPDLALTQIAVEVVTVILILLAMYFLPKESPRESSGWQWLSHGGLAVGLGVGVGWLAWAVMTRDVHSISMEHVRLSKQAGGTNVVNLILVDFRGFDTFNEIIVLGIAALGIYALLDGAMHGRAAAKLDTWRPDQPRCPDRHPALLVIPTRVMLPLALMVGIYFFLRGHNQPGGGFVAGLVVTIALIMQYMISGYEWANERIAIDYHRWIGLGVLLAAGTGIGAMVMNHAFLKSAHYHFDWPLIGEFDVASALVFDAGVLLTVVGAVMLALANLSRLGRRADKAAARAAQLAGQTERE